MKTSTTTPRKPRKTSSTSAAKATPAEKKVATPRVRRAAPKSKKTTTDDTSAPAHAAPTVDDVRFRAYEIYLQRNGYGDELSDWLQAEQELLA